MVSDDSKTKYNEILKIHYYLEKDRKIIKKEQISCSFLFLLFVV
jgi:hypothetical protein